MTDETHSNNKEPSEWSKREMGALWKKDGKTQKFYSGFLKFKSGGGDNPEEEVSVIIFANRHKDKNERAPDLIVYRSEDPKKVSVDHDEIPETFI